MGNELTIKEYAAFERVNERTVRRWIEKGALRVRRTPGGGIRIPSAALASSGVVILRSSPDDQGHPSE